MLQASYYSTELFDLNQRIDQLRGSRHLDLRNVLYIFRVFQDRYVYILIFFVCVVGGGLKYIPFPFRRRATITLPLFLRFASI